MAEVSTTNDTMKTVELVVRMIEQTQNGNLIWTGEPSRQAIRRTGFKGPRYFDVTPRTYYAVLDGVRYRMRRSNAALFGPRLRFMSDKKDMNAPGRPIFTLASIDENGLTRERLPSVAALSDLWLTIRYMQSRSAERARGNGTSSQFIGNA